ncbi:MAG: aldehyde dehydrogenase family protein, partial [bacterium]|nr:aldehyde dehydrogenase family protein [bacterium]
SIHTRTYLLLKMSALFKNQKDKLGKIITSEMGKPITQSIGEIDKCAWLCEYYAENTEKFLEPEYIETDASESYIQYDPLGALLGIMPWNFPFWQVFRFAIPAIMAGNVILIKHAPNVSLTALQIEKLFLEAGFPESVLQVLLVEVDKVEGIIADNRVKGVSVTASERTGSIVASQAGKKIKKTVLELGGSDPFIILDDADVNLACDAGVVSRLVNSGQTCISAKRFIVVESRYEEFLKAYTEKMGEKRVGDPMDNDTDVG